MQEGVLKFCYYPFSLEIVVSNIRLTGNSSSPFLSPCSGLRVPGQDWSSTFRLQTCFSPLLSCVMHSLSEAVSLWSFLSSATPSFLILSSRIPHPFLLCLGAGLRSPLPRWGPLLPKGSICQNLLSSFSTVSSCDPLTTSLETVTAQNIQVFSVFTLRPALSNSL